MQHVKGKSIVPKPFITSRRFLILIACILFIVLIFFWKNYESKDLSHLQMQTEANAVFMASDVEARYRGILNSLQRLGNDGPPDILSSD